MYCEWPWLTPKLVHLVRLQLIAQSLSALLHFSCSAVANRSWAGTRLLLCPSPRLPVASIPSLLLQSHRPLLAPYSPPSNIHPFHPSHFRISSIRPFQLNDCLWIAFYPPLHTDWCRVVADRVFISAQLSSYPASTFLAAHHSNTAHNVYLLLWRPSTAAHAPPITKPSLPCTVSQPPQ